MFPRRKRSAESAGTVSSGPPPANLRCSFCDKAQADVRKLIAGPEVCICDECVEVCVEIITQDEEVERQARAPASGPRERPRSSRARGADAVTCGLCGAAALLSEVLKVEDRWFLCGECADAIEDVLARGVPLKPPEGA